MGPVKVPETPGTIEDVRRPTIEASDPDQPHRPSAELWRNIPRIHQIRGEFATSSAAPPRAQLAAEHLAGCTASHRPGIDRKCAGHMTLFGSGAKGDHGGTTACGEHAAPREHAMGNSCDCGAHTARGTPALPRCLGPYAPDYQPVWESRNCPMVGVLGLFALMCGSVRVMT